MIVQITRFVFTTAGALGGYAASGYVDWSATTGFPPYLVILIFLILGTAIGFVLGGIMGRELALVYTRAEARLRDLSGTDVALGVVGLVVGLLVAFLGSVPLRYVQPVWLAVTAMAMLFVLCGAIGVQVALLKRDDVVSAFPRFDPSEGGSAESKGLSVKLLDTSAVIDGRFSELVELGVLEGTVRVPRFVLVELQTLADSADDSRRSRGRRGLDLLARLQGARSPQVFEADYPTLPDVDAKLIRLAEDSGGVIVTVDYNLTKVARARSLEAINLNEIAAALKPSHLPGEKLVIKVLREGKEAGQGVGYLEDGTMVVIQEGSEHVGSTAEVEVTSVLQTSAGRMVFSRFARTVEGKPDA